MLHLRGVRGHRLWCNQLSAGERVARRREHRRRPAACLASVWRGERLLGSAAAVELFDREAARLSPAQSGFGSARASETAGARERRQE
jgi:hypothetical protein